LRPDLPLKGVKGCLLSLATGVISTLVGLLLSNISKFAFPLVMTIAIYPIYYLDLRQGRSWEASKHVLLWALSSSITLILLTALLGEGIGELILHGTSYKQEMLDWIKTGKGPEGDPRLFIVPKLREIAIFSVLCLFSAGFLGLFLGSFLLNYMNYYVGCIIIHARPGKLWVPLIFGWPIYAILRVVGYVNLGIVLSVPIFSKILKVEFDERQVKRQLYLAILTIALDFILKGTVANLVYQPLLRGAIELG